MDRYEWIKDKTSVKYSLREILFAVSWGEMADRYFHRRPSWLYSRFDGIDAEGNKVSFTEEDKMQLKAALIDLSERIRKASEEIA